MKGLLESKGEKITPEQQEQVDIFVVNGMSLIHNEKTSKALINQIVNSPDPIEAVANATITIVGRLEQSAAENKMKLSDITLVHGGNQLMAEIIAVAEAGGMEPFTEEQRFQSFSLAVSKYLKGAVNSGKITPEQLQQMSQEVQATPQGKEIAEKIKKGDRGLQEAQSPQKPEDTGTMEKTQKQRPQRQGGIA